MSVKFRFGISSDCQKTVDEANLVNRLS